jgi:hypothetical protein
MCEKSSPNGAGCPKFLEPSRWQRIKQRLRGWLFGVGRKNGYFILIGLLLIIIGALIGLISAGLIYNSPYTLISYLYFLLDLASWVFWIGCFVTFIGVIVRNRKN